MTTKFFSERYTKDDLKLLGLKLNNNDLFLKVEMNTYIELIANGYRPEIDLSQIKTFIFKEVAFDGGLNEPYSLDDFYYSDRLHLIINNIDIIVNSNDIEIV